MAKPAVFAQLDFEAALARSRESQSVLIVDAMATWCGPCREMDRVTWSDAAVVARLTGPAFAIQVDVDKEQAVAARLEVQAMPTLIAFRAGVEHDRLVGGRGPGALIEWLDIVERGERYEDAQRAARVAIQERRSRATSLLTNKAYDAALALYVEIWPDDDVIAEIRELVTAHAPARIAFSEVRDATTPGSSAWMQLNQIIDDVDATIRWYDANAADLPPGRATLAVVAMVIPLLIERGRWKDIGIAIGDPIAFFTPFKRLPKPDQREVASNLVRALYAAGRAERADDLEYEVTSLDPSPELAALLATAKQLGRA
jgi:thioredoxin 1